MNLSFPPDTPSYFADAESSFNDAAFVLYGVPYEQTVTFRKGTKQGPMQIRKASWNFESFNPHTTIDLQDIQIHDYGNLGSIEKVSSEEMIQRVKTFTKIIVQQNKTPIALGGEHSISAGVLHGFPTDTCVIVFDAHADFRESYQHNPFNHACTIRRMADYVGSENILICGLRSAGKEEYKMLQQENISIITAYELHKQGIEGFQEIIKQHTKGKNVFLSIDIDAIDPAYAPGTGTPEPFGLHPLTIIEIIDRIAPTIKGFDIMEVNPLFDTGQTALLAAKIIRHTIERIASF